MAQDQIQGTLISAAAASRRRFLAQCCAPSLLAFGSSGALAKPAKKPPAGRTKPIEAPKPEKRSFTLATTNPAALPYLPVLVAQKLGLFAQMGLDLEITEHQSTSRAMQAVGAGQADAVCAWLENMLSPGGRALGLQSYVLLGQAPMMALGVAQKSAPSIQTLAQLRGRMLGVVALNSPTHTLAVAALRSAGLRPSDVGTVSVGSPASALAALRSGQIDALMHMEPLMLQLEQRGEVQILADLRSPASTFALLGEAMASSCLASTAETLLRFPGTIQACADAMYQALQWLEKASLRDIVYLLPDSLVGIDTQLFVASLARLREAYSADGLCSAPQLQGTWQTMREAEPTLRLEKIDPWRSVNNALMLRSAARLRG
jgi:NitT/TauT family transport system substrate-binding protein